MKSDISLTLSPIAPWPLLVGASLAVIALTLWPYSKRLRGTDGRWRWVAVSLRMLALLLCLMAATRPSVFLKVKKKQASSVVVLFDRSTSMLIGDEVRGQSRWAVAKQAIKQANEFAKTLGPELDVRYYGFDSTVSEPKATELDTLPEPKGRETKLGPAMLEVQKRQENTSRRMARLLIISDFTANAGTDPLEVARQLKGQGVPIVTVGVGTENAGAVHKDIAVRDLVTSATVFVKNELPVKGRIVARGFANQSLGVALYVEGHAEPVAKAQVKIPDGVDTVPFELKYTPQAAGEQQFTVKVAPQEGELVVTNNEMSTFVSVLSGGLNVLFLQGPNFTWDYRYLARAIGRSRDIQVEGALLRRPAQADSSEIDDAEFAAGKYNVYILSDLPADFLTVKQHRLLVKAVKNGAGFMMLGGRSSFGAGGWANTDVAEILPVDIHPGDGQLEPEQGVKLVPTPLGLDNSFILQVGANRAETAKIWQSMPPVLGTNRFSGPKLSASVLATTSGPNAEPLMLSIEPGGKGRVVAYGGDTWVWARATEEGRLAHRKFWRQCIFWLSHKEDDGENHVKLTVDPRRVRAGENIELTASARDAKGAAIPNVSYECKIEREGPNPVVEPVELYNQGEEARASKFATENLGQPGNYTAKVIARRNGTELGRDTARFLVYQDDRELDNPSADLKLAREMSQLTDGEAVTPEKLLAYLKGIDRSSYTEYMSPSEYKVWDNWPFLLIFAAVLTLEWWLRKRHGWV